MNFCMSANFIFIPSQSLTIEYQSMGAISTTKNNFLHIRVHHSVGKKGMVVGEGDEEADGWEIGSVLV